MKAPLKRLRRVGRIGFLAACVVSACASFADVSTIVDLRPVAIVADPSEVILTVTGLPADPLMTSLAALAAVQIDPASIPTIHLTPLVVDPRPASAGRALTYSLVGCPNNPYGAAPPMSNGGNPDPSGGARTTVGSTLCDDAKVKWTLGENIPAGDTFAVTLTPAQLLQAFATDVYLDQDGRPHGGFDLGLPINLELTITNGVDTVRAVKRVLFWAQRLTGIDADGKVVPQKVNVAPTIPGLLTFPDRTPDTWAPVEPVLPLDAGQPAHVALGKSLWILPQKVEDAMGRDLDAEEYVTTVIERDPPRLAVPVVVPRERLRYAFYATAGHFDPARTVNELLPGVLGKVHLEARYVPPATLEDVPVDPAMGLRLVTVWIVARDDRGGEAWVERTLALDPAP